MKRILGKSGIETSAMGLGCWAIGGPWTMNGGQAGWSAVDDAESEKAIRRAMDLGVNFFDTAANYGAGHSERVLGRAIAGRRDKVVISTKFGYKVDEAAKNVSNWGEREETSDVARHVSESLEESLSRLGTDYVDVYLLHVWGLELEKAEEVRAELEKLVTAGKIRTYGWSTDRADAVEAFSASPNCAVVQQQLSVLDGNLELLALSQRLGLASMNRGPLGMGILTGKFTEKSVFKKDDHRSSVTWHPGFKNGQPTREWLAALDGIRGVLTSGGRTLAQGSLAWLWAKSPNTIPIPGFRNVAQAEENARAMQHGPLSAKDLADIDGILAGFPR